MNEEYLWDKTGEPDPEIQQLEQLLGTLRYQPKPLVIPGELNLERRRNYLPLLAIAATVLIALLGAGLWWQLENRKTAVHKQAIVETPKPTTDGVLQDESLLAGGNGASKQKTATQPTNRRSSSVPGFVSRNSRHRGSTPASTLTANERREALEAKEQLLMALRVASEKLNLAQKKIQNPAPTNQQRNQHRVG
jgi:hypothetical protein